MSGQSGVVDKGVRPSAGWATLPDVEWIFGGLGGAVVGGIIGAVVAHWFEGRRLHGERQHQGAFAVYMDLIGLIGRQWWLTVAEVHGEEPDGKIRNDYNSWAWKVADRLRTVDDLPEAPAVLDAMFSLRFASEQEREKALRTVADRLGQRVNPRYAEAMHKIGAANDSLMASNPDEWWRRWNKIRP